MKKKDYMKPSMEVLETRLEELMQIGSVTDVITPELDEDEGLIPPGTNPDDPWGGAQ